MPLFVRTGPLPRPRYDVVPAVRLMARPNNFPPTARHAAREARQAAADERAAKLAPLIKALQAAGVTSLNGLAVALNARGVVTPAGGSQWHATQVRRVLARLTGTRITGRGFSLSDCPNSSH
jgi:hypothetical protein